MLPTYRCQCGLKVTEPKKYPGSNVDLSMEADNPMSFTSSVIRTATHTCRYVGRNSQSTPITSSGRCCYTFTWRLRLQCHAGCVSGHDTQCLMRKGYPSCPASLDLPLARRRTISGTAQDYYRRSEASETSSGRKTGCVKVCSLCLENARLISGEVKIMKLEMNTVPACRVNIKILKPQQA